MPPASPDTLSSRLPSKSEAETAEQLLHALSSQPEHSEGTAITFSMTDGQLETIAMPQPLMAALTDLLSLVSSCRGLYIVPFNEELTTQQAADILNVSRPYLVKMLETGEIPFTKTGTHRRIRAENLFDYKKKRDEKRSKIMSELISEDAEFL